MRQPNHITRFAAREDGAGTVFSLFIFVILCVLLGIMVDATNAWRNKTMLAAAADMGSHAGAVTLAYDGTEEEAVAAARLQVRKNLPQNLFGDLSEREGDVFLLHYDTATRQLYDNGPRNAVAVRTNQLSERNNAVGTFLLSLAGIFSWDVDEVSVTVFDVSSECLGTDGIYSEEQIRVAAGSHFGTGYCLHSNDRVWLPQTISFDSDTQVSMPDLDDCGNKCYPDANPGIVAKEFPMVFPDFGAYILSTYDAFDSLGLNNDTKSEFFTDDPDDENDANITLGDLTELIKAKDLTDAEAADITLGSLIELTHAQFHALETLPSGLVYKVMCNSAGNNASTKLTFSGTTGKMRHAALLTNCSLDFKEGSEVQGSMVITTRISSSATVTSDQNVTIGDTDAGSCELADRTTIMSMSGVSVPAGFATSNVTLVVDDTVDIASATSSSTESYGLTIYATGKVDIAAQHTFISCGPQGKTPVPQGKLIRHVATN